MIFKDQDKFIAVSAPDVKPFRYSFGDRKQYTLVINRPSLRDYLDFEAEYARLLATYLPMFAGIQFLTYKDLADMTALEKFVVELQRVSYNWKFVRSIKRIILKFRRVFRPSNFMICELDLIATKTEINHIFLFIHMLVELEKKNSWAALTEMEKSGLLDLMQSSIFSKESSDGVTPKFGAPMSFTSFRSSEKRTSTR
jgi:hypothetical protein